MPTKVLDVGNCAPDHAAVKQLLIGNFTCEVVQAHGPDDALAALHGDDFALVLINRKLDQDYSDGVEVLRRIKADEAIADVPVMLVTNFPEHQDAAVRQGAERGFGKLEFEQPQTIERLARFLAVDQADPE